MSMMMMLLMMVAVGSWLSQWLPAAAALRPRARWKWPRVKNYDSWSAFNSFLPDDEETLWSH